MVWLCFFSTISIFLQKKRVFSKMKMGLSRQHTDAIAGFAVFVNLTCFETVLSRTLTEVLTNDVFFFFFRLKSTDCRRVNLGPAGRPVPLLIERLILIETHYVCKESYFYDFPSTGTGTSRGFTFFFKLSVFKNLTWTFFSN